MSSRKFPLPVWIVTGLLVCASFAPAFPVVNYPLPTTPLLSRDHAPTGAWLDFLEEHPHWRVLDWDRFHVLPHRAWGDGIPLGKGAVLSGEDLDHRLRKFMNRYPDLFPPTEAVLNPLTWVVMENSGTPATTSTGTGTVWSKRRRFSGSRRTVVW
jgi:hypothetical protein